MCMLTVLPAGVALDSAVIDGLTNGARQNDDGHGWAIAIPRERRIITGRGMDADDVIDSFADARDKYGDGPALFHSRWATHGSVGTANCHPFRVGGRTDMVLAHNGVLPRDAHPSAGDDRSDTRILADWILPRRYARLDRPHVYGRLADWLGSNKVAVLTVDRRYRHNLYLFGRKLGQTPDGPGGVWYSNGDWRSRTARWDSYGWTYPGSSAGTGARAGTRPGALVTRGALILPGRSGSQGDADASPAAGASGSGGDGCVWCDAGAAACAGGYCERCWTCQDCLDPVDVCECAYPGADRAAGAGRAMVLGPTGRKRMADADGPHAGASWWRDALAGLGGLGGSAQ